MALELLTNLGSTTTSGDIAATDTSVTVAALNDATYNWRAFPSSGNFHVVLGAEPGASEIARVTAVDTVNRVFTLVRGVEGTTPTAWPSGTVIAIVATQESINQAIADAYSNGPYATRPARGRPTGSRFDPIDGHTPWVWDSVNSLWRLEVAGGLAYQPPVASTFTGTLINSPGSLSDTGQGALEYSGVNDAANSTTFRGFAASFTGPGFVEFCAATEMSINSATTTWYGLGAFLRESSSGKFILVGLGSNVGNLTYYTEVSIWSASGTRTSIGAYPNSEVGGPMLHRIRWDKTNVYADVSRDGFRWFNVQTTALGTVFTTAPDQVGIGGYAAGGTAKFLMLGMRYAPYGALVTLDDGMQGRSSPRIFQPPPSTLQHVRMPVARGF